MVGISSQPSKTREIVRLPTGRTGARQAAMVLLKMTARLPPTMPLLRWVFIIGGWQRRRREVDMDVVDTVFIAGCLHGGQVPGRPQAAGAREENNRCCCGVYRMAREEVDMHVVAVVLS